MCKTSFIWIISLWHAKYIFEGDKMTYKTRYKRLFHRLCGRSESHLKSEEKKASFFLHFKTVCCIPKENEMQGCVVH